MTYFDIGWSPRNAAQRVEEGKKSLFFPDTGLPEIEKRSAPCVACVKGESHRPCEALALAVPFGETRHERIADPEKFRVDALQKVHFALWAAGYIQNGLPDPQFNLGEGNNVTQASRPNNPGRFP